MEKIQGVHKLLMQLKNILDILFDATSKFVNYSLFLKNAEKNVSNLTYKKKTSSFTLNIYRNIYRKNLLGIIY